MKKIAVYFSGRINKYEHSLEFLKHLQNKYQVDYFCSLNIHEMDEYHATFIEQLQIKHFFFQEHSDVYQTDWFERFRRLPRSAGEHPHAWYKISSSFYNNKKAFELIENCQEENKYDIIVKYRADIVPHQDLVFPDSIEPNTVYIPNGEDHTYHSDDPYYHFEGINDWLAYGDFESMKIYSNVYDKVDEYCSNGRPYHPESLRLYHLEMNHLKIERFPFHFWVHPDRHLPTDTFYHPEQESKT